MISFSLISWVWVMRGTLGWPFAARMAFSRCSPLSFASCREDVRLGDGFDILQLLLVRRILLPLLSLAPFDEALDGAVRPDVDIGHAHVVVGAPREICHHTPWCSVVAGAVVVVAAGGAVPFIAAVGLGHQDAPVAVDVLDDEVGEGTVAAKHAGVAIHGVKQLGVVARRVMGGVCLAVGEGDWVLIHCWLAAATLL